MATQLLLAAVWIRVKIDNFAATRLIAAFEIQVCLPVTPESCPYINENSSHLQYPAAVSEDSTPGPKPRPVAADSDLFMEQYSKEIRYGQHQRFRAITISIAASCQLVDLCVGHGIGRAILFSHPGH
jgi:hypothetical protein